MAPTPGAFEINTWIGASVLSHKYGALTLECVPSREWDTIAEFCSDLTHNNLGRLDKTDAFTKRQSTREEQAT